MGLLELSWYHGPMEIRPSSTVLDNSTYMGSLNVASWEEAMLVVDSICKRIPVPLSDLQLPRSTLRLGLPGSRFQAVDSETAEFEQRTSGRMWTRGVRSKASVGDVHSLAVPGYAHWGRSPWMLSYDIRSVEFPWIPERSRCVEVQESIDWARDVLCALRRDGWLVTGDAPGYSDRVKCPWVLGSP